jgi:hypothetical protein
MIECKRYRTGSRQVGVNLMIFVNTSTAWWWPLERVETSCLYTTIQQIQYISVQLCSTDLHHPIFIYTTGMAPPKHFLQVIRIQVHYHGHNSPPSSRPCVTFRNTLFNIGNFNLSFDLRASWPHFACCPRKSTHYIPSSTSVCKMMRLRVVKE